MNTAGAAPLPKRRVAILISGRGSNMMSLVGAAQHDGYPAEIVAVISNRPEAAGLAWARAQGVPTFAINHKNYASRSAFEAELQAVLDKVGAELVALAGVMRLLTEDFTRHWARRMINIHPSLLPAFKGLSTHERVLAAGVRITGCTVHFVVAEMDGGPIIGQAAVPVRADDSPDTLAARVLAAEHRLYPQALAAVASGNVTATDNGIQVRQMHPVSSETEETLMICPPAQQS